jgi:arylsulfatase A
MMNRFGYKAAALANQQQSRMPMGQGQGHSCSLHPVDRSRQARSLMERLSLVAIICLLAQGLAAPTKAASPNIVLIMADDLGYGELGCYGGSRCRTPQLDRLAATGLRLTDFHSNGAVCSPTRAALMTGRYQQRSGIDGVVTAKHHRQRGLAIVEETIADLLTRGGYATAMFGKWHLGYSPRFSPTRQGFSEFGGFVSGNIDLFSHIDQEGWYDWWRQGDLVAEPGYAPHLITDRGIDFLKRNHDRPFFLYLAHPAPHYPYQGPIDQPNRSVRQGPRPADLVVEKTVPTLKGEDAGRAYRQMVEDLDLQVGRIVDALTDLGVREQTLLVFCSDNGGIAKPGLGGDNGPLRGKKGQLYEGGHRVPAIFNWPGRVLPRVSQQTALTFDFLPTFAALAGITPTATPDGTSLKGLLLDGHSLPIRPLAWLSGSRMAYREGPWKLILNKQFPELYNLDVDLGETNNLVAEELDRVNRMQAAALALRDQIRGTVTMQTGS